MSWLELDDGILDHPKFIRAIKIGGSETVHLWLGLRAYCGKQLTDGFVPNDMIDEVRGPRDSKKRAAALEALRTVSLLDPADGGVQMHNYLKWSKSREQVLAMRKQARDRQAKSRGGHTVTPGVTPRAITERRGVVRSGEGTDLDDSDQSGSRVQVAARADLQAMAALWRTDPNLASLSAPNPEKWPETLRLVSKLKAVFGGADQSPRHQGDPRMQVLLALWAEGRQQSELERAIDGAKLDDHIRGKPQLQTLQTILKDSAAVDKYLRLLDVAPLAAPVKTNPRAVQPDHGEDPYAGVAQ